MESQCSYTLGCSEFSVPGITFGIAWTQNQKSLEPGLGEQFLGGSFHVVASPPSSCLPHLSPVIFSVCPPNPVSFSGHRLAPASCDLIETSSSDISTFSISLASLPLIVARLHGHNGPSSVHRPEKPLFSETIDGATPPESYSGAVGLHVWKEEPHSLLLKSQRRKHLIKCIPRPCAVAAAPTCPTPDPPPPPDLATAFLSACQYAPHAMAALKKA